MSLIFCPEFNKEVSDKAEICPNCGYPIQKISNQVFNENIYEYNGIQVDISEVYYYI